MSISGIYTITNIVNGKIYVGSSNNIERRNTEHFRALRNGKHNNKHLQNAYNKYGEDAFAFEILCECHPDQLKDAEQNMLDSLEPFFPGGYNIAKSVDCPNRGVKLSEEHRSKLSEARKGEYSGEKNPKARLIEYNGKTHCLRTWALILDIPYGRLKARISTYGWEIPRAFETPRCVPEYEYQGDKKTLKEWSKFLNIPYGTLRARISTYGWEIPRAFETPVNKNMSRAKKNFH